MIFPPSSAMSARPRCSSATTRRPPDGNLPHTRSLPAPGGAEAAQLLRLHRPNRHGTHTAVCSRRRIARTCGSVAARETVGARLGRPRAAAKKTSYSCRPGECNTAVAKGRCWRRRPRLFPAPLARHAPDALRAPDKPSSRWAAGPMRRCLRWQPWPRCQGPRAGYAVHGHGCQRRGFPSRAF